MDRQSDHLVKPVAEKHEAAVPPCQQHLVSGGGHVRGDLAGGGCKAEGRGFFFFSGQRAASLVAVAILGVAAVISVVATYRRSASLTDSSLDNLNVSRGDSSLGAAVCILGQLSRLEIESKMQNIIQPLSNHTKVDVFLSLETGDHGFFFNPVTADVAGTQCRGSDLDVDGVKEAFAPYFRDGVFEPHVDVNFSQNVTLERWPLLYKSKHPGENASHYAKRRAIISNDFNQMRHLKDCAELIHRSEESAGGKYDVVVKVRDNTIALRPVVPEKLVSIREVTLKHCDSWDGVNDKVMALPRKFLEKSLGAIYPSMLAVMNDDPLDDTLLQLSRSRNTEQIVMFTLVGNEVPFRKRAFEIGDRDGDDYLPFVDGRCFPSKEPGGDGRWCIVSHCKDCWPSVPWTYNVTCEVAVTGLEVPGVGSTPPKGAPVEQTLADPDPERKCRENRSFLV